MDIVISNEQTRFTCGLSRKVSMFASSGCFLLFVMLVITLPAALAAGSTINVPTDKSTIQMAIDAAAAGDTVLVAPGSYTENIDFKGKAITVTSSGGAEVTTIDGNQAGPVVVFRNSETSASILDGFTLKNGTAGWVEPYVGSGGGIKIFEASPVIRNNRITANTADDGGGIYIGFGSPLINANVITLNTSHGDGGGIQVGGAGSAQVIDNIITDNSSNYGGGGVSLWAAGTPAVRGNIIRGNSAFGAGGGISMVNLSDALIVQNLITGNRAGNGGGVAWGVPASSRGPYLISNTIANNDSPVGSAVYADGFDKDALLANNIIVAKQGQSAVYCTDSYDNIPPIFRNNITYSTDAIPYGSHCGDQNGFNGNITADPLLNGSVAGYYAPLPGSPAIDAGDNSAPSIPASDLAGSSRTIDGNGDGSITVDMGAYEFDPTRPVATISGTPPLFTTQKSATFSFGGEGVAAYRYSVDGKPFTTAPTPITTPRSLADLADGPHSLAVTGINANGGEQLVPFATVAAWTVDTTPPATTASPAGGTFFAILQVTLACQDGTGSGCAETSYCLGSACTPATPYTGAISLNHATELRFQSIDKLGNSESVRTVPFVIGLDLAVATAGPGSGTVTGSAFSCQSGTPSGCTTLAPIGEPVLLTAEAKIGSVFAGWNGCDGVSGTNNSVCSVILTIPRTVTARFNLALPGPPTDVTAVAGNGQATVSFNPPPVDGNIAISSYTATSNPGGISASASASPITITGLANGVAYTFTVTANNVSGAGQPSGPSNAVTPKVPSIIINKGAKYTRTATVLLDLAYPGATAMQFSTNGKRWSKWESFAPVKQLKLSGGNGMKAVSVRFRNSSAIVSNISTATIMFDSKAPKTGKLTLVPENGGATLTWQGFSDATSDIVGYRLVSGIYRYPDCNAEPLYSGMGTGFFDERPGSGLNYYYQVCAVDSAGNISRGARVKLMAH